MRPGRIRLLRTQANGQAACGFYRPGGESGPRSLRAIQLVTTQDGRLRALDHFVGGTLFKAFGLPDTP